MFKKILIFPLLLMCIFNLFSCDDTVGSVVGQLPDYVSMEHYIEGWQDCIVYNKYTYENITEEGLKNAGFKCVTDENVNEVYEIVDEYCRWLNAADEDSEIVKNYDFSKDHINLGDFYYLEIEKQDIHGTEYITSFNLYFLDIETKILYYFHNNT